MQVNVLLLFCTVAPVMSMLRGTGDQSLMTNMQPEVVRKLLNNVQHKWIQARAMVLSNATSDDDAFPEMEKSCVKVSSAIVEGSEGLKDRVTEYMQDVCAINSAHNDQDLCSSFASSVVASMTDDSEYNRDTLTMTRFCRKLWDNAVDNAAQAEARERAEEAEKERKEKEEAEKKAAAEREAAEKKAAAEREEAEKKAAAERTEAEKEAAARAAVEATQEKAAAEKASQEAAEEAARVKAYEAYVAQANKTSHLANSTETQASSNSSTAPAGLAEQETSTANATSAPNAEPPAVPETTEKETNATSTADAQATEEKTNSASVAQIGDKNATVATKK